MTNQRKFFDDLAQTLHITKLDDWYTVPTKLAYHCGGHRVLPLYKNSLVRALMAIYPEHSWDIHRFIQLPRRFWDDTNNQKQYLQKIMKELGLQQLSDLNIITKEYLMHNGGVALLKRYRGLQNFLKQFVPRDTTTTSVPTFHRLRSQHQLEHMVKQILPFHEVVFNFYSSSLCFYSSGRTMELDVMLPELALVLEYQGQQHYHSFLFFQNLAAQQRRDTEKAEICRKFGLTLIHIPYWWNRTKQSLVATIAMHRPDIFPPNTLTTMTPIPDVPPSSTKRNKNGR